MGGKTPGPGRAIPSRRALRGDVVARGARTGRPRTRRPRGLRAGAGGPRPRPAVPPPLIEQLAPQGRLIAPAIDGTRQRFTLLEKTIDDIRSVLVFGDTIPSSSARG